MAEAQPPLQDPWLIAAWPGMGNVAVGAAGYLVNQLGATLTHELPSQGLFEIEQVDVKAGLARPSRLPRNMFFEWRDPNGRHDLLIFVSEAQPDQGGYNLCQRLMDYAKERGVQRLFTFAAMATQLHPANQPRVFGVATNRSLLGELREHEAEILKEGQIGGLNGVLLAVGEENDVPGVCLMGELPFFAAGVPNPTASMAVLRTFAGLLDLELDYAELEQQSEAVQQGLVRLLEQMKQASDQGDEAGFTLPEFAQPDIETLEDEDEDEGDESTSSPEPKLEPAIRQRIERLFQDAEGDRNKAFRLKEELDRLGVFDQYEDRFLDLFKKAE